MLAISASAKESLWHEGFASAVAAAEETRRPILVEFYGNGCGPCTRMEQETLADPDVATFIGEHFEPVRVNALQQSELATKYVVSFYPTVKFIDADGSAVYDSQGYIPSDEFMAVMRSALDAHRALERARAAADGDPTNAQEAVATARDFLSARQYEQAADWAREALALDDAPVAEASYVLGCALMEMGEPSQAASALESALAQAPEADWRLDAQLKLGFAWLQRGDEAEGIAMLRRVHGAENAGPALKTEAARLLEWWGADVD